MQRSNKKEITLREIRARLKSLENKERAQLSLRYFKTGRGEYGEGDRFLGISNPQLHQLVREYKEAPLKVLAALLRGSIHEERCLALLVLVKKYSRGDPALRQEIFDLYLNHTAHINNWDLVDLSAPGIVGAHLIDKKRDVLFRFAKSSLLWERRIAMIATAYFIREHDFQDALRIAKVLLADSEDLMHKAVGWMLREIGKRDRSAEEAFLRKHYRAMPRTMLRYAIEKFPESLRQQYLRGEI